MGDDWGDGEMVEYVSGKASDAVGLGVSGRFSETTPVAQEAARSLVTCKGKAGSGGDGAKGLETAKNDVSDLGDDLESRDKAVIKSEGTTGVKGENDD
jgi:hypothetical protein